MKVVDRLEQFPSFCLVTGNAEGPFVDFEAHYDQAQIGLHVEVVKQAARKLGMVEAEFIEETLQKLTEAQEALESQRAIVEEAQAVLDFKRKIEEVPDASAA